MPKVVERVYDRPCRNVSLLQSVFGDFTPKSWNHPARFYTFAVNLKVKGANFGRYLYVGGHVNSLLEPKREFTVEAIYP